MSYLSTSSSSSSSLYATATSSKRMSGLVSGLDTDELVKQLTMGTQNKIDKQSQNKQIAAWQQSGYREIIAAVAEFNSKYFSSSTSSSSILSSSFFNSTSIVNGSSFLNISGSTSAAKNMVITGITQLASQASFSSAHKVSSEAISTGEIKAQWTKSTITNASMTLNYGGKDYTFYLDSSFSPDQSTGMDQYIDQLNLELDDLGLKDDLEFKLDGSNVALQSKTGKAVTIKSGTQALLDGLGLKAKTTSGADNSIVGETAADTAYFFNHSITAGSKMDVTVGGQTYTLKIASDIALPVGGDMANTAKALQTGLEESIKANSDLKGKLSVSVSDTGEITFSSASGDVSITNASQNLKEGLGLSDGTSSGQIPTDMTGLFSSYLGESLSGSTVTFDLNGLKKAVTFNESDKSIYSTFSSGAEHTDAYGNPTDLIGYLQQKLDAAYGDGKITVDADASGGLTFQMNSGSETDVLSISASDKSGVLGKDGALHIYAGESNRINTSKNLRDISGELSSSLPNTDTAGSTYDISVNGKKFSFHASDSLDTIIKTINNDTDANVTITYSQTLDTFSVAAKNGGAASKVDFSGDNENGTSLLGALFGTKGTDYTATVGQDAILSVSFDGNAADAKTITRSSNKFTLDGVDFELLKKTDETVSTDDPITFTVSNKTDDLVKKMSDFITDYNNILKMINDKVYEKKPTDGTYAPLTDAQKKEMSETQIKDWETKAKQGLFLNDSLLDGFSLDLRHAMTDKVESVQYALYQAGIATTDYNDNGKLTVDEDKLKQALADDPDKIASLFTGTDGIAAKLQSVMKKYTNDSLIDTGLLVGKAGTDTGNVSQNTLSKEMQDYDSKISDLKDQLETEQEYYYNKFTLLEQYISQMNSQASFFQSNSSDS